jgi:hypothetical protein
MIVTHPVAAQRDDFSTAATESMEERIETKSWDQNNGGLQCGSG